MRPPKARPMPRRQAPSATKAPKAGGAGRFSVRRENFRFRRRNSVHQRSTPQRSALRSGRLWLLARNLLRHDSMAVRQTRWLIASMVLAVAAIALLASAGERAGVGGARGGAGDAGGVHRAGAEPCRPFACSLQEHRARGGARAALAA